MPPRAEGAAIESVEPRAAERQALSEIVPEGSPLHSYLDWVTNRHGSLLYHLVCAVTLATHELSRKGFHLRRRQYPMALWFALIGESASGKSVALDAIEAFSRELWTVARVNANEPWIEVEGTIAGLLGALHPHYDPARDTTTGLLYQHEMSAILQTREPIAEMLCRIADGRTYNRHLKGQQDKKRRKRDDDENDVPDKIINPVVSALFAATEDALAAHFKAFHRQGGLFSRIWWVKPRFGSENLRMDLDHVDAVDEDAQTDTTLDAWTGWLAALDLIGAESREIGISPEAHEVLRVGLFDGARTDFRDGDDVNAVRLRIVDKARVFAAVFATMRGRNVIEAEDMQRAVALGKLLLDHTDRMAALGSNEAFRLALRIEKMLIRGGELTRRDLYKLLRIDKATLEPVLETLIDRDEVVCVPSERRGDLYIHRSHAEESEAYQASRSDATVIDITPGASRRPRVTRR